MTNLNYITNLTPHAITIAPESGVKTIIPPSGKVARVKTSDRVVAVALQGIEIVATTIDAVDGIDGLPAGAAIIVSSMVLDNLPPNCPYEAYAPDTGATAIRNADGQIEAVTRLRTRVR